MQSSITLTKKSASSGKGGFQKSSGALLSPPDNNAASQEGAKLGIPVLGSLRGKVALKPGRSLMDWMKLGRSGIDLSGTGGRLLKVTPEELARHNKEDDGWMVLNGKVYNVTPYMEYHPGGIPELMRGVGADGSQLFNEVHQWVNYDSMLAKCLVGKYVPSVTTTPVHTGLDENQDVNGLKIDSTNGNLCSPRYTWTQTEKTVTVSISMENRVLRDENVIVDCSNKSIHLQLLIDDFLYHFEQELEESVAKLEVVADSSSGRVDVVLWKETPGKQWESLGKDGSRHNQWKKQLDEEITYRCCTVNSVTSVTHDTKLYCMEFPEGTHMIVPVGRHIFVSRRISGETVAREYTVVPLSLRPEVRDERVSEGRALYLMIKIYPDGLLTPAISCLTPGDELDISTRYAGNFDASHLTGISRLIMYAAGTGFTPMASLLHHCLSHPSTVSVRQMQLVFFNKEEKDILWKEDLDQLSCSLEGRFTVHHVLSVPHPKWSGLTGYVRKELMESLSAKPENSQDVLFCVCGPVPFTQKVIRFAEELGYTNDRIIAFTS